MIREQQKLIMNSVIKIKFENYFSCSVVGPESLNMPKLHNPGYVSKKSFINDILAAAEKTTSHRESRQAQINDLTRMNVST